MVEITVFLILMSLIFGCVSVGSHKSNCDVPTGGLEKDIYIVVKDDVDTAVAFPTVTAGVMASLPELKVGKKWGVWQFDKNSVKFDAPSVRNDRSVVGYDHTLTLAKSGFNQAMMLDLEKNQAAEFYILVQNRQNPAKYIFLGNGRDGIMLESDNYSSGGAPTDPNKSDIVFKGFYTHKPYTVAAPPDAADVIAFT